MRYRCFIKCNNHKIILELQWLYLDALTNYIKQMGEANVNIFKYIFRPVVAQGHKRTIGYGFDSLSGSGVEAKRGVEFRH